jgi:hypothetical protein
MLLLGATIRIDLTKSKHCQYLYWPNTEVILKQTQVNLRDFSYSVVTSESELDVFEFVGLKQYKSICLLV